MIFFYFVAKQTSVWHDQPMWKYSMVLVRLYFENICGLTIRTLVPFDLTVGLML